MHSKTDSIEIMISDETDEVTATGLEPRTT